MNKIIEGKSETDTNEKKTFKRFPRYAVNDVLMFAREIQKQGYKLKRDRLYGFLNMSEKSSTSGKKLAAARAYNLIKDTKDEYIDITDLGKRAISEDSNEQILAFTEAMSNIDLFQRFLNKFSESKLPSKEVAKDYAKDELHLNDNDAEFFYNVMERNINDAHLIEQLPGGAFLRNKPSQNSDEEQTIQEEPITEEHTQTNTIIGKETLKVQDNKSSGSASGGQVVALHFNIQIHLPESTDPDVYDAIFKSIKANLLGNQ